MTWKKQENQLCACARESIFLAKRDEFRASGRKGRSVLEDENRAVPGEPGSRRESDRVESSRPQQRLRI